MLEIIKTVILDAQEADLLTGVPRRVRAGSEIQEILVQLTAMHGIENRPVFLSIPLDIQESEAPEGVGYRPTRQRSLMAQPTAKAATAVNPPIKAIPRLKVSPGWR